MGIMVGTIAAGRQEGSIESLHMVHRQDADREQDWTLAGLLKPQSQPPEINLLQHDNTS